MGRPLVVVVAADNQAAALRVAADLDQCGFAPQFSLATNQAELEKLAPDCEVLIAWREGQSLPAASVLDAWARREGAPPILVYGETFSDDEIVAFMRSGARDCLRRGDLKRIRTAVERETAHVVAGKTHGGSDADDRYRALIEEIPALTYVAYADESGSRAYVSPQLQAMTGYRPDEWVADPGMWLRRLHPEDRAEVIRRYREACATGERFSAEYRILDREGRAVWWRDEGRVLPVAEGAPRFVRGFVLDISEQKLAEESLRRLRFYDPLTGLPNRVLLLRRLGRALAETVHSGRPLGLLILALDRYRELRNTLGHQNSDAIIRELATRLSEALGPDRVARLRGDEFGLLLPDGDVGGTRQTAERVLGALESPFTVQQLPIEISGNVGMAVAPEHGSDANTLLRRADSAVQAARRLGGGASVLYSPRCEPHDPAQLALLSELRRAIEQDELRLHYQPKVDLKTHAVVGAEALLRWPHPRHGFVPPSEFVALAEQTGLIRHLTRWVLDRAATESHQWGCAAKRLTVAVNVSVRNLRDSRLIEDVEHALQAHGLPPACLTIEVTESAVMTDPARAADVLGSLKERGVAVAIDDFGTGYSSLGLLRRLPVSELKIDKAFVLGMAGEGGEDTAIVRSTADLAHNLGLCVVAEGVEDQWTLDLLASFGCDQAQGYHIARPMPGAELAEWLTRSSWRTAGS